MHIVADMDLEPYLQREQTVTIQNHLYLTTQGIHIISLVQTHRQSTDIPTTATARSTTKVIHTEPPISVAVRINRLDISEQLPEQKSNQHGTLHGRILMRNSEGDKT